MKVKSKILGIILLVLIWFIFVETFFGSLVMSDEEKIELENHRVEEHNYRMTVYTPTVNKAIEEKTPELCLSLRGYVYYRGWDWEGKTSIRAMYKNDCLFEYIEKHPDPDVCSLVVEGRFGEDRNHMPNPKNQCLNSVYGRLARDTDNEMYCGLQQEVNEWEGDRCLYRIAENKNNSDLCQQISDSNYQVLCRAVASRDTDICYKYQKDEHDTSKYSRGVGGCIGDVVRRTKNYASCLDIDGPDYGEQWRVRRNKCLEYAEAYRAGEQHKSKRELCHLMVEDNSGFRELERCLANEFLKMY